MNITDVSLKNYRNFESLTLNLAPGINILYGDNAQGKTNFLEAVYFCASGRANRARTDAELVMIGKEQAHIRLTVERDASVRDRVDIHIRRGNGKGIAVNGISMRKIGELFGVLYAVIFSPEDLRLIKSGPSERRRFMDMEICQLSSVYYYDLRQYHKILKQRNNLLKEINRVKGSGSQLKETLFAWDRQLLNHGKKIIVKRREFIDKINSVSKTIHYHITNMSENLSVIYRPDVNEQDFEDRLNRNVQKDILYGTTSVGVHKDDVIFLINDMETRVYGSQGQQRTAALAAKLAQVNIICEEKGTKPVLLLDDVLSELDKPRQNHLFNYIMDIQTIITATGAVDILNKLKNFKNIKVFEVKNGEISLTNQI